MLNKKKNVIITIIFAGLLLSGSIITFIVTQPKRPTTDETKLSVAKEVETESVDVASKTEVSTELRSDNLATVAQDTGIDEQTLINAVGADNKGSLSVPENATVEVISNVLVEKQGDAYVATINKDVNNTIQQTVVPVAVPVNNAESKDIVGTGKTIVIVKDKEQKPVAHAVVVTTTLVDNKPRYVSTKPIQPKVLETEVAQKIEVKEVAKTEVENKVKEVVIAEKVEKKVEESKQPVVTNKPQETKQVVNNQPVETTRQVVNTPVETKPVAVDKWIESTQTYNEMGTETYTDYVEETYTEYVPNMVEIPIMKERMYVMNNSGTDATLPGIKKSSKGEKVILGWLEDLEGVYCFSSYCAINSSDKAILSVYFLGFSAI